MNYVIITHKIVNSTSGTFYTRKQATYFVYIRLTAYTFKIGQSLKRVYCNQQYIMSPICW